MTWAKTWHRGPAAKDAIVVGHDGSSGGAHALATALELAGQVHASVVVGRAWSIATAPRPPTWKFGYVSSHLQRSRAVDVKYRNVHGRPAKSLIAISNEARMLLLGSRGPATPQLWFSVPSATSVVRARRHFRSWSSWVSSWVSTDPGQAFGRSTCLPPRRSP
jgi:nucleotide-binding universal stress UspA family protein